MRRLILFLLCLAVMAFVAGFAGQVHPAFDAIAVGRWVAFLSALGLLSGYLLILRKLRLAAMSLLLLLLAGFTARISPDGESGVIRVYTKNIYYRTSDVSALIADIRLANPDLVFLQEVSTSNDAILTELQNDLPFQALCPWQGWNGIAILSRWPLLQAAPRCSPERSLLAIEVKHPQQPFWAVGVHLQQPWPDVQWEHLERALPVLEGIAGRAIVAGDFNTMPWTSAARQIGELTGTEYIETQQPTFRLWGIGLPLDQVWALGGRAEVRPEFGSDHRGVVADVWPSQPTQ